ncbi:MAG: DNA polymerase III subunit delta' [Rhodothermales bacterium]
MSWTSIIDQRRTIEALKSTIASERIAHAYLFHGPDGVGKRAVAIEYGKTLLCERGGTEACGKCLPCTKVSRMVHPDLHILFPYPSDTDLEDVGERIRLLGKNPYAAVDFVRRPTLGDPTKSTNKQALYTVSRMHEEVRREMSFKPVEGKYKIAVMTDADLLRTEAANAFLKLLEEPAPRTIFILTTSRTDRMLPTILSRCQRFRFDPLAPEAIEQELVEREGTEPALAATLARMADGSYTAALDLAQNEELRGLRELVLDFFRMSYAKKVDRLADQVEQTARLGRDQVKHVLELMLRWVRDLVLYRSLGDDAPLVNVDQRDAIAKFNDNLPDADLEAMASILEEAVELIERNVHVTLTLTVLSQTLAAAMRGPHSGKLYLPLSDEPLRKSA